MGVGDAWGPLLLLFLFFSSSSSPSSCHAAPIWRLGAIHPCTQWVSAVSFPSAGVVNVKDGGD